MTKTNKVFILVATLILCVLMLCVRLTGVAVHLILGCVLVIFSVKHVTKHWALLKHRNRGIRIVDYLILITLLLLFCTGMALRPGNQIMIVLILHKMVGLLFVIAVIIHACQHMSKKKKV